MSRRESLSTHYKVISTVSVGFDHIDVRECMRRGIRVGHTPDVLTQACAELTISLTLAILRRMKESMRIVESGEWGLRKGFALEWLLGREICSSVVGICGYGRIGTRVAEILHAFKPSLILYTSAHAHTSDIATHVSLDELLEKSDIVICTASLNQTTVGLFNRSAFEKMKKCAVFVNTSRGKLVNHDDLYTALVTKTIAGFQLILGAALDVTDPEPVDKDFPLLGLDNCIVLPHLASATIHAREMIADLAISNMLAGLNKEEMPAEVKQT